MYKGTYLRSGNSQTFFRSALTTYLECDLAAYPWQVAFKFFLISNLNDRKCCLLVQCPYQHAKENTHLSRLSIFSMQNSMEDICFILQWKMQHIAIVSAATHFDSIHSEHCAFHFHNLHSINVCDS